jgi:hypothetical protein
VVLVRFQHGGVLPLRGFKIALFWHMSKTIASGVGLNNAWLAEQGLLSMKTLWAKLAPLR